MNATNAISLDELLSKVKHFQELRKESNKLGSWPAYRYEQIEDYGEEKVENVYREFYKLRNEMINIFNIKSQGYNGGHGLDAQQIAERMITESYATKWYKKYC